MATLTVVKLEWELGEKYGDVFSPSTVLAWKEKIHALHTKAKLEEYPFQVFMKFDDPTIKFAFTVGHFYSFVIFVCDLELEGRKRSDQYYLSNPLGDVNEIVPCYIYTHYTEPDTTKMLPFEQVLKAVDYLIDHRKFPSFIRFDDDEVNRRFVEPDNQ